MSTPTITTAGASSGLLKITDQDGVITRIPLATLSYVADTSNASTYRLDISHARGDLTLIYASSAEVTAALSTIDALY